MTTRALSVDPGCAGDHDPNSLPLDAALARVLERMTPPPGRERVGIRHALGRVLAQDVRSPFDVPSHTNSAMDGYALNAADLPAQDTVTLPVAGTVLAGSPLDHAVPRGQCARIMTGGMMPGGTDTVVMQEQVEVVDDGVRIGAGHEPGQNVRAAGEDIAAGEVAVPAGKRVRPAELGLLASLGIAEVNVHRRVRVAYFSTGDELRGIGEALRPGDIYDSNRYTLYGMLTRLNAEVLDMGVVPDEREATRTAFREAAAAGDVVIASAGASVGEADYVTEILAELGEVDFWKMAMKPGRPLAFGRVGDAWFFGLPGNPVSVMATFYQVVQPALRRLMGESEVLAPRVRVPAATALRKKPGRVEFQRGILEYGEDGHLQVRTTGQQGSGILASMSRANCFIVLPHDAGRVEAGTEVEVEPFEGLV